ncbi:BlaI/MecI/CopY family transcriptional regulator [Emticicia agri]|uniref:BlaI/MecI/CopY family transcriptional regulator n=1 Tax=Emticicia agri TaxID=2492393 RepID=A0A4Q5LVJ6_9BACT|nr:BlaI/MecI/CopY family transcriptional regulator [Emticicia agri]RYU93483.1 BlaI/MecI/CopY family transcriptional regulator [Emticicia agri]
MQKLTAQEEQAMKAIWQLGETHIRAILEVLGEEETPYTTLASTIKNLEKKGFLSSRKIGNVSLYEPLVTEEAYKNSFLHKFVEDYFDNSYQQMVNFFVENKKLTPAQLKEIITMIESEKK